MRLFGSHKPRSAKAASLRASSSFSTRLGEQLSNSDILLRLLISFLGILGMTAAVEAWKLPFRHRLGDLSESGILARTRFERIDADKTERARQKVEDTIPPVFVHDSRPLTDLSDNLYGVLFDVATVASLVDLSAESRAALGLAASPAATATGADHPTDEIERTWTLLKSAVGGRVGADQRIGALVAAFEEGIVAPLKEFGILDPAEVAAREMRPEDMIAIVHEETPDEPVFATVADVLLIENLKPAGRLGRRWNQSPLLTPLQLVLERWLLNRAVPTLTFDEDRTGRSVQEARRSVDPVKETFKRGAPIVAPGQYLTPERLAVLTEEHRAIEADATLWERIARVATVCVLLGVLAVFVSCHLLRRESRLIARPGRLLVYWLAMIVTVGLGRALSYDPWRAEIIPILCTVMVLAIAYNQFLAAISGFALSLVVTIATGRGLDQFVVLAAAVVLASVQLSHVSHRSKVITVGLVTAIGCFVVSWGMEIIHAERFSRLLQDGPLLKTSLLAAFWCITAGYLVAGSMPFIEAAFDVVTDISLLELGDISHPLLQELIRRAPGTYNHSVAVATISETAADAIGANGLLCRVAAYFHDIGKMLKPQYFVENTTPGSVSRHEHLAPAMSTLIIIGHVKDGADLARQHNLPQSLIDFIEQHHGTTLVEYFFHAATRQAEALPEQQRSVVEESSFRYPGPKPQRKETAVVMLADAVEGASRALSDPAPKRIETLVHEIAMKRLLDGQFEECGLTLSELAIVEDSLTKSLIGIYHGRIKYPEQQRSGEIRLAAAN